MTINKAKKTLGKRYKDSSDEEIGREIEMATFLAEIVMRKYKENKAAKM